MPLVAPRAQSANSSGPAIFGADVRQSQPFCVRRTGATGHKWKKPRLSEPWESAEVVEVEAAFAGAQKVRR